MSETRGEAISILEAGSHSVRDLIAKLPPGFLTRPGLGGGEWSAKDLMGHLASWEEHALEALEAWSRDERASIDRELHSRGTNAVNAEGVKSKAKLTMNEVLHDADVAHASIVDAIERMTDAAWERPATSRGRKALGHRLGQIMGGPAGGFRHAEAHMKSLAAFVEDLAGRM